MSDDSESKDKNVLDLGLAGLAEQCDLQLDLRLAKLIARRASEQNDRQMPEGSQADLEFLEAHEVTEYEHLWQTRKFNELTSLCERNFSSQRDEEKIIAKLWWVRSHGILGQVPVSILSAPLEFACSSLDKLEEGDKSHIVDFTIQVAEELARRLAENGDREQSLEWYRRIEDLGQDRSSQIVQLLRGLQSSLLEIPEYARTDNQTQQLRELARNLDERGQVSHDHITEPFSSKKLDSSSLPEKKKKVSSIVGASFFRSLLSVNMFRQITLVRLILILGISTTVGIAYVSFSEALAPALLSDELIHLKSQQGQQLSPIPERMESAVALSAIFNSIENGEKGLPQDVLTDERSSVGSNTDSTQDTASNPASVPAQVLSNSTTPGISNGRQIPPEVNTREPREPRQIYEILSSVNAPRAEPARVIDENFVRGFPGASGQQGIAVYRYNPPRLYRVLRETAFLARPSESAQRIDTISADVNLVVEEDLGLWLKVRRKDDRIGYVASQDTEFTGKKYIP